MQIGERGHVSAIPWMPALWVKAQKPVMGLLKGVLTLTASAIMSSTCTVVRAGGTSRESRTITYLLELVQLVLALGVLRGSYGHTGKETTEGLWPS
jgi:hypothetical protein